MTTSTDDDGKPKARLEIHLLDLNEQRAEQLATRYVGEERIKEIRTIGHRHLMVSIDHTGIDVELITEAQFRASVASPGRYEIDDKVETIVHVIGARPKALPPMAVPPAAPPATVRSTTLWGALRRWVIRRLEDQ